MRRKAEFESDSGIRSGIGVGYKLKPNGTGTGGQIGNHQFAFKGAGLDNHRQSESLYGEKVAFRKRRNERSVGIGLVVDHCVGIVRGFAAHTFDPHITIAERQSLAGENRVQLGESSRRQRNVGKRFGKGSAWFSRDHGEA